MRAIFHRDSGEEEQVSVLDIFVDEEGTAKVLFIGANDEIIAAPINRFTNYEGGIKKNDPLDQSKGTDN